jgi:hypothetical protein
MKYSTIVKIASNLIMTMGLTMGISSCKLLNAISSIPNAAYTTATNLGDDWNSDGRSSKYEYTVKGKKYTFSGPYFARMVKGDKFRIKYDSLHPGIYELLPEEPVFLPGEKTVKVIGVVDIVLKKSCEFYFYQADNQEKFHRKIQQYYKGTLEKYPNIKKNAMFEVEYDSNNPLRAIIYFERPVK